MAIRHHTATANHAYHQFHLRGIDDADDDFREDNLSHGDDHPAFDVEDLAKLYMMQRDDGISDVHALAKAAVVDYMAWFERNEGSESFLEQYEEEIEEEDVDEARAYEQWKIGYGEGLVNTLADAIWDRYGEILEDGEGVVAEAAANPARRSKKPKRPKANPGDPVTIWRETGSWDAGHAFSSPDLEDHDGVEFDEAVEELASSNTTDPARLRELAGKLADQFFASLDEDGYEADWFEQNKSTIEEMGHLPSEAYKEWKVGYRDRIVPQIAKHLDEEARAAREER